MFPLPWASRAQASLPGTWNLMTKRENSWENSWAVVGWDQWHTEEWSLDGIQSSSYGHSAWPPLVPPLSPFHNVTTCLDVILLNTKLSSLCLSVYYPQNNTVKIYFISHYTAIYPTLLYAKFFFPFLKCSCSQVLLYFAWGLDHIILSFFLNWGIADVQCYLSFRCTTVIHNFYFIYFWFTIFKGYILTLFLTSAVSST